MNFIIYGMNHTTAPVSVRERFALPPEKAREVLGRLKDAAQEAVFLPTCNRVEFYLGLERVEAGREAVQKALGGRGGLKGPDFRRYFYLHQGPEAFRHLFRVASSLDSMVVGESQILGQVKEAYRYSREWGMTGGFLNGIFHRAFAAAKKVRSGTEIARTPVSVSSVAVSLAKRIFSDLRNHRVLILGAGEMSELTARHLREAGVEDFLIANRTPAKAEILAKDLGGKAVSLPQALEGLAGADIVVASMGGGVHLDRGKVEGAMSERGGRPLFLVDIAVPRNVDPDAGKLDSVYLYNIDDLGGIAAANRQEREKAVAAADAILQAELEELCAWVDRLEIVPAMVRLRERFEAVRSAEWERFLADNPGVGEKEKERIERLTKSILGKLLHDPTLRLKGIKDPADRFDFARMLDEIFLSGGPEDRR